MNFDDYVIVWLKRDLRLVDHAPFRAAIESGYPILIIYILEDSLVQDPHYSDRHWHFVADSLLEMDNTLKSKFGTGLTVIHSEALGFFQKLNAWKKPKTVYSYCETGLGITFNRDTALAKFFNTETIEWLEFQQNGVKRGLGNRKNWREDWHTFMKMSLDTPNWAKFKAFSLPKDEFDEMIISGKLHLQKRNSIFQKGGESQAQRYLQSFLKDRVSQYNSHISKPALSRKSCSRLSPYIAWGNLSMRQVFQQMEQSKPQSPSRWHLASFGSRLRWHCHFIQKFEMECSMEFQNINSGYDTIRKDWNDPHFEAWKNGQTGYPLVDASMRCVRETGYLNFRMRAMVVSFLTHHLWLDWRKGAQHLAACFLDFEPGIHYPQFQMQSGVTGINTVRIYNPVKQSLENDSDAVFIKEWVPEISHLPLVFIHEPWKMTDMEQMIYHCQLAVDYPQRIVNIEESGRKARDILFSMQKEASVKVSSNRILKKHTNPNRMS
ncbi:FAD-binding domain-containing protein [Peijinzhouia sedimentorum]